MDKRDFYRELMDSYAFDKEKIYNNAKNGRLSGKNKLRSMPVYIGMTAAAAALVVTVGTIAAVSIGNHGVQPLASGENVGALTSEQRIANGINAVRENENSKELVDVLVTFSRPLSPAEAQGVLLARAEGSVPVKSLFMEDGTKIDGSDGVGAVFVGGSGNGKVTGAVVRCAGYLMTSFQDNDLVLAVELYDPQNIFEPVVPIVPDSTSDNSSSDSISESTGSISESLTSSETSSDTPETSEPDSSTVEPSEPSTFQLTNHINEADGGAENVYIENTDVHQINIPDNIAAKLPEGVTLPKESEKFSCKTDDVGALRAYFLNDNVFYVRTENDIRLYTVVDGETELTASMPCAEAKVFWIGENGGSLLALGNGNSIYEVNADDGVIREISLAEAVGSGEIKEIAYNAGFGILALNVYEKGEYSLKIYEGGFEPNKLKTLYSSADNFVLIGADGGMVYFGMYYGDALRVYRVSPTEEADIVGSIQGEYDVTVNTAFTHAVLDDGRMKLIYNPLSLNVVLAGNSSEIDFGVSAHSFIRDGDYYTVGEENSLPSGGVSVISKIDFKNSFSRYYTAIPDNGAVRIVEGSYTERARNDYLTFETPVENAAAEVRGSLDAAVGLQNAIAGGDCGSCGINDAEKLKQTLAALYTENTAAEFAARCIVDDNDGSSINDGGIAKIRLSETVLNVSDETDGVVSGTLYVYAGNFDGKAAYYTYPVKLVKSDSGYLVDCVIG